MAELPLVAFTLLLQAAVGAAWAVGLLGLWLDAGSHRALAGPGWTLVAGLAVLGLAVSCAHLARPGRAWRAIGHWRTSWLSREVLLATAFAAAAGAGAGLEPLGAPGGSWARGAALGLGPAAVLTMARAYRLAPVPAWSAASTPLMFLGSTFLLGGLAGGALLAALPDLPPALARPAWTGLTLAVVVLAAGQLVLTERWLATLPGERPDAGVGLVRARLVLGGLGLGAALLALAFPDQAAPRLGAAAALAGGEVLGRILFYAGRTAHGVYRHPG